jgi:hypothetical protein
MKLADLDLDPDILAALKHLGARERARSRPLCPNCGHNPQSTPHGLCAACLDARHEREKAAKRRWWAKHGKDWRAERNAAARAGTLGQPKRAPRPARVDPRQVNE